MIVKPKPKLYRQPLHWRRKARVERYIEHITGKRKRLDQLDSPFEYKLALNSAGSRYQAALLRWWITRGRFDGQPDLLRELLRCAWVGIEYPEQDLSRAWWIAQFRRVGIDGAEGPHRTRRVWRGCVPRYRNGMAWTTDPAAARAYAYECARLAKRHPHPGRGCVYMALIPPVGILDTMRGMDGVVSKDGYFAVEEVIVDPSYLTNSRRDRPS